MIVIRFCTSTTFDGILRETYVDGGRMVYARWGVDRQTGLELVTFHKIPLKHQGMSEVRSISGVFHAVENLAGMLVVVFEKDADITRTMQAVVNALGLLEYLAEAFTDERTGATWIPTT